MMKQPYPKIPRFSVQFSAPQKACYIRRTTFILLSYFLLISNTRADEGETKRDFGFRPLEIFSFENRTGHLTVIDINNDGLDDVLFVNNHVSRLEILVRKTDIEETEDLPELEERFENKGMIVDQAVKALRVADLNNDERLDLITFGTTIGLQLRYQQNDGSFDAPQRIFIKDPGNVTALKVADLNGDAWEDILICRRDQAAIYWNAASRPFRENKTLTFSADKCISGNTADINSDGITDLIFFFGVNRNSVKIHYGQGGGIFGTEQPIDLPPRQFTHLFTPEGQPPQIGTILRNRRAFRLYDFTEKEQHALLDAQEISPARIGLQGANKNSNVAWITGDFNTDSYGDLLVAAPELSRLHLYFGNAQGLAPEPKGIDTLSSVTRISRLSTGDMIVVSKKEKIAAIHSIDDITRFPTILNLPGSVIAGCGIEASTDSWFICKNEDKELQLARIERTDGEKTSIYPLDIKNDPNDLLAFQLPDRKVGLILFMPYALPKMYLFANEQLDPLTSESFRALSRQLTLSNIRMEAPGDGAVLTVAQGAIARRFEWKGDRYEVTRQFNPENPQGEMVASCNYALADGSTGTFFYDRNTGELIRFSAANKGWGKIHIPDADQTIFDLVQLQNKKRDSIVLIDRTGINEILGNGSRLAPIANAEYVSPAEDPMLAYVDTVNLGSPPRPMIALVDHANRTIELVSQHDDELKTDLVFEVFLVSDFVNPSNSRGTEPHGIESGDLNGDNIGDLVILCQDKLLIYMGE